MLLREECGGYASVGLRHRVLVDHAADVTGVTWHFLATHHVGGAADPVGCVLAAVTVDVLIHLGTRWKISMAHHALFERNASHVALNTA